MKRLLIGLVAATLGVGLGAPPAEASSSLVWSIDGSIANSGLPAGFGPGLALGPNVSSTKDGTQIEIAGSGRFSPRDRWIDGGGAYRIVDPNGKVVKAGRWKPAGLSSYRDLGFEYGVPTLIAGIIVAPIELQGGGKGKLVFYCGAKQGEEELEGVDVTVGRQRFSRIDSGSTTIEES